MQFLHSQALCLVHGQLIKKISPPTIGDKPHGDQQEYPPELTADWIDVGKDLAKVHAEPDSGKQVADNQKNLADAAKKTKDILSKEGQEAAERVRKFYEKMYQKKYKYGGPKVKLPPAPTRAPAKKRSHSIENPVQASSAYGVIRTGQRPVTTRLPEGDIRVQHSELFADITVPATSTEFNATGYDINVADSMFPWLSDLATQYERYRIESLVFKFMSNVASSTAGRIYLGVDYDGADDAPSSGAAMSLLSSNVMANVWVPEVILHCDKAALRGLGLWLTTDSVAKDGHAESFASLAGRFFVATEGVPVNTVCGSVIVEYVVRLHLPHSDPGAIALRSSRYLTTSGGARVGGVAAPAVHLGTMCPYLDSSLGWENLGDFAPPSVTTYSSYQSGRLRVRVHSAGAYDVYILPQTAGKYSIDLITLGAATAASGYTFTGIGAVRTLVGNLGAAGIFGAGNSWWGAMFTVTRSFSVPSATNGLRVVFAGSASADGTSFIRITRISDH